jgi:hypothetical protein
MLVLPGQDIQQRRPQIRKPAEPVEDLAMQQEAVQQSRRGAVQSIFPTLHVPEPIGSSRWAMPGMPLAAIGVLDMQVDGDLADVV